MTTTNRAMSRRYLLAAGAGSLAVACGGATPLPTSAPALGATHQEEMVRKWYAAWKTKDWGSLDSQRGTGRVGEPGLHARA